MNNNFGFSKTVLIIIIAIVIALGIGVYMMMNQQTPEGNIDPLQPPPPSSGGNQVPAVIPDWKVYANTEYKFSLQYPKQYSSFETEAPFERDYGAMISPSQLSLEYKEQISPIWGVISYLNNKDSSLRISIFSSQKYSVINAPTGEEIQFNPLTKTWTKHTVTNKYKGENFSPETKMIGGKSAAVFSLGDAGNAGTIYAIPTENNNIVEIHFMRGPQTQSAAMEMDKILSTFQFIQ